MADLFVVRYWDSTDGWIDVSAEVPREDADRIWNVLTENGTKRTSYNEGEYYKVFPIHNIVNRGGDNG